MKTSVMNKMGGAGLRDGSILIICPDCVRIAAVDIPFIRMPRASPVNVPGGAAKKVTKASQAICLFTIVRHKGLHAISL